MHKLFKYRCFPNHPQKRIMEEILEKCRIVYNKTLEYRKNKWENERKNVYKYDTHKLLPIWKREDTSLNIPYAQTLQQVQERVDLAFKAFFCRCKNGETPGYPRFKGKGRYDSFTYPQMQRGMNINENIATLPRIGKLRFKKHREIEGKIKKVTLKRDLTGKWYIFLCIEIEKDHTLTKNNESIGIDLGIHSFAVFSNGNKINSHKFYKIYEKELSKAKRKFEVTKRGSKERAKRQKIIATIYAKIRNGRHNFIHQESRKLINKYGVICLENLKAERMQTKVSTINKALNDASWYPFIQALIYKAEEAGRSVVLVNPAYTSQICSRCGSRKKLKLTERTYSCEKCNLEIDRDENAAINILRLGLQSLDRKRSAKPSV